MFDFDLEQMDLNPQEINKLLRVSRVLNSTLDHGTVIAEVLEQALEVTGSEAGTLWLFTEDGEYLEPAIARGGRSEGLKGLKLRRGEGLAGQVADTGQAVLVEDVTKDERWAKRFDQSTGFVTRSMMVVPLFTREKTIGSLQIINKRNGELFSGRDLHFAAALAGQCAIIVENSRVYTNRGQFLETMLKNLSSAIETRDEYSVGHAERVALLALMIAGEMSMSEKEKKNVEMAAYLHDIGKIGIQEKVLATAGPMDREAWESVKKHTAVGARILYQMEPKAVIRQMWAGAMYHHENYDGTGYPVSLSGDDIPLVARILAVADCYDNLTTDKFYRKAMSSTEAVLEIRKKAGRELDPHVVDMLVGALEKQGSDPKRR